MLSRTALRETNGFEGGDHAIAFEVLWTCKLSGDRWLLIYVAPLQVGYRVPKRLPATRRERFVKLQFILQVSGAGQPVFRAFWSLVAPEKFPMQ